MNGIGIPFGDPLAPTKFWGKIFRHGGPTPKNGKCWYWRGTCCPYGVFWDEKRSWIAHRYSWQVLVCAIPDGLDIDHLCKETICVNPAHLQPVTRPENSRRQRGYFHTPDGYCVRGHVVPEGQKAANCKECQRVRYLAERSRCEAAGV